MATARWLTTAAAGAMLTGAVLAGSEGLAMADSGRPVVTVGDTSSPSDSASASASASASGSASASPSAPASTSASPSTSTTTAAPVPSGGVNTGGGATSTEVPLTMAAGLVLLVAGATTAGTVLWRRRTDAG